ncbi:MAG: cyclic nucleotide-binding domain-containing protein [Halobacteriovoraceae bacterium]|jgi:CRP-like cAMP-binding protein|nr:cyclic nucleotide-binding domain-containing protein [Halobacteriovoraceae bacterium]MBT5093045.1 cyclic nucleotide-binding domain-containing protein [Halobacteriovoraceae bacterium]
MDDLTKHFRNIKIFDNLTDQQVESILLIAEKRLIASGEVVMRDAEPSCELLLIISGSFEVRNGDISLAKIVDAGIVGEMGVFTEQTHCADVVALMETKALSVPKKELFDLIEKDKDLGLKIYQNIIVVLARHLRDHNLYLEFSDALGN